MKTYRGMVVKYGFAEIEAESEEEACEIIKKMKDREFDWPAPDEHRIVYEQITEN